MTFRGTIQNGKVILDEPVPLPNGTPVSVEPVAKRRARGSVYRLYDLAVSDDGLPADYAGEMDHYLYGTPKRTRPAKPAGRRSRPAKAPSKTRAKARKTSKRRSR